MTAPLEQLQNSLRCCISLCERRNAGLLQDLQLGQLHLLVGEVGVGNAAARSLVVVLRRSQIVQLERKTPLIGTDVGKFVGYGLDGCVDLGDRRASRGGRTDVETRHAQAAGRKRTDRDLKGVAPLSVDLEGECAGGKERRAVEFGLSNDVVNFGRQRIKLVLDGGPARKCPWCRWQPARPFPSWSGGFP